jgi:hypothetical protein
VGAARPDWELVVIGLDQVEPAVVEMHPSQEVL